jgi:hypothetical protein
MWRAGFRGARDDFSFFLSALLIFFFMSGAIDLHVESGDPGVACRKVPTSVLIAAVSN